MLAGVYWFPCAKGTLLGANGDGITSRLGTWSGVRADWLPTLREDGALRCDEWEVDTDRPGAMDGA